MVEVHYADPEKVKTLTNRVKPAKNTTKYEELLLIALDDADDTINGKLIAKKVTIPTIPEDHTTIDKKDPLTTLIKAGILYTASFMFNTYYADNESLSPTSRAYEKSADQKVSTYIEIILEGYNEDTKKQEREVPKFSSLI